MLHFPAQESLDTLRYGINRAEKRLPQAIALSHLVRNSQPVAQHHQAVQIAQERLAWFEPHLPLIADIEAFLIELPDSPPNRFIRQQWRKAIEQIGDLTVPQSQIQLLALHCDLLAMGWSFIADTFHQMKDLRSTGYESQLLEDCFSTFLQQVDQLWQNFFDLSNPSASEAIAACIKQISLIQIQLMEINS
ncbi:hypothetical protein [Nostoc sp. C110]|uniref:hypothetical protein n=1 Tax=Nostoc sp. C110 TaxID=3349876 RepID=UPI00370D6360